MLPHAFMTPVSLHSDERTLQSNSRAYAKARRQRSPDLTFQDIKQAGPDNVDLLIRPEQAKVVAIDGSQLCLQLNRDLCWDPQKSVYCGAARIEVIHHEDSWIWVDTLEGVAVGQTCTQIHRGLG